MEKLQCFGFFGWCGKSPRMKIEEFHNLLVVIGDCFNKTGTNLHANHLSCVISTKLSVRNIQETKAERGRAIPVQCYAGTLVFYEGYSYMEPGI